MTPDLLTQLERYGSVMDDAVPPLDVELSRPDFAVAATTAMPWSRGPKPRPVFVLALAFTAVLVTGVLFWSVARSGDGTGPVDDPTRRGIIPAGPELDPALGTRRDVGSSRLVPSSIPRWACPTNR